MPKAKLFQIYGWLPDVTIALTHSAKKLRRLERMMGVASDPSELENDAYTVYRRPDPDFFIVYMNPKSLEHSLEEDVGLLAHEAVHIAQAHLDSFGESKPASEEQAYLVQAITTELVRRHSKWRKKHMM